MNNKIEKNEEYFLKKIRKKDMPIILKWFNDSNLCKYMEDSKPNYTYNEKDFNSMLKSNNNFYFSFLHNKKIIGYASIYYINNKNNSAEFSFLIGDSNYRKKGLGKLLLEMISQKGIKLNIKKLYCSILKENIPSIKTILKSGFIKINEPQIYPNPKAWNNHELHFLKII